MLALTRVAHLSAHLNNLVNPVKAQGKVVDRNATPLTWNDLPPHFRRARSICCFIKSHLYIRGSLNEPDLAFELIHCQFVVLLIGSIATDRFHGFERNSEVGKGD
jgi:hypothetical protein